MNFSRTLCIVTIMLLLSGCATPDPRFQGADENERIHKFFDWSFNQLVDLKPMTMTEIGINRKQDQLDDFSEAHQKHTRDMVKEHLNILNSFDRSELSPKNQVSYDLYEIMAEEELEDWNWRHYKYFVNQMFGLQQKIPGFMINLHRVKTEKDLKNYIARLNGFKVAFGQVVTRLMKSEKAGVLPPQFVFPKVIKSSKNIITGRPFDKTKKDSPLLADFKTKLKSLKLKSSVARNYQAQAIKALTGSVGPGYSQLIVFLEGQSRRASTDDGVWKFPDGKAYYQYRLRKMTTTEMTADQIHNMGLRNVKRIHDEMDLIRKKVAFKGDLKAFFDHVRENKFYYPNNVAGRKSYIQKAKKFIRDMEKQLDRMFILKPKARIDVKAVEDYRKHSAGMAFYETPTVDGSRPGTYYVNLVNMKALPRWEAEALAYHEGIPGHHMQLSIAQELKGIPEFQKYIHFTAYIEGWGLYSENFPKEYGFYKDPYSDFGRLSMELVRASRLVVDSGIHAKKWTREKAIRYLDENLPGDHDDNIRQIERYIVMPGQATAYLVGMRKILEFKKKAHAKLGQKFDIRKFHDVVLGSGPLPLDILEKLVNQYIQDASKLTTPSRESKK